MTQTTEDPTPEEIALVAAAHALRDHFANGYEASGSPNGYVDYEVNDRRAAAAAIMAFLKALPEYVSACKTHDEIADYVSDALLVTRIQQVGDRLECWACGEVANWCQCDPSPFHPTPDEEDEEDD